MSFRIIPGLLAAGSLCLASIGVLAAGTRASSQPPAAKLFVSPAGEPYRAPMDQPYPVGAWFAAADRNVDGQLTQAEFVADGARFFAVVDNDGSGTLEPVELDRYEREIVPELGMVRMPAGGGGARPPDGMPPGASPAGAGGGSPPGMRPRSRSMADMPRGAGLFGLINSPQPVKAADADMNARVTTAEFQRILRSRFAMLDGDGDGVLRFADLPETPMQQMLRKRRWPG